jgi:hypothetical protein
MVDWIGGAFDPEAFDLDEVNTSPRGRRQRSFYGPQPDLEALGKS